MWELMIAVHAAAGLGAFAVGAVAIDPARAARRPATLPALVALLVVMTVSVVAAMAAHWSTLPGASQAVFTALVGLAVYMVHRSLRASRSARRATDPVASGYVDDLGFVLIALFDGFVVVAALDLGAPAWAAAAVAVAAVVVGHRAVARAKRTAAVGRAG